MMKNTSLGKRRNSAEDLSDSNVPLDLSENAKFKRYHSDTSLEDYNSLLNSVPPATTGTALREVFQDAFVWEDLHLRELFQEECMLNSAPQANTGTTLGEVF